MGIGGFFKSLLEGGRVDVSKRFEILREAVSGTMSDFNMARDRHTGAAGFQLRFGRRLLGRPGQRKHPGLVVRGSEPD